ncbi:GNAT family acetyltransferase [Rhodotorula taiwanensis]|uniref:GNAT family acetyltransferase n=1 Tax=Rhodotorula taiwanensis TaxID=741276 RepID=A0A2S5BGS3_9BASI|nr:GNAT family acetyltransferase [Rhodotorula taiwanensis]
MLAPCSFSSERLVYRAFTFPDDDAFLLDLVRDEATQMGWFGGITRPHSLTMLESFKKFLETAPLAVVICIKTEDGQAGQPMGVVDLEKRGPGQHSMCAGFGLVIHKDHQRKGYGHEAMEWILRRAFVGHNFHRIQGDVWEWNEPALKIYKSLGFVLEGRQRKAVWQEGAWRDNLMLGILREEWLERHPDAQALQ